ncbi:MAG TPA: hypothetical protein VII32_08255 [Thermoanaerobaculia bacterium]
MIALATLLLAITFPSSSKTSWMRPESFHLTIGMDRDATIKTLADRGWDAKETDQDDQLVIDYGDDKAVTLQFQRNRLRSIRFELFLFLPEAKVAFEEERTYLRQSLGAPKKLKSKSVLLYDSMLPNVMVVLNADPKTENGRRGVGVLVVRYYDPRQR